MLRLASGLFGSFSGSVAPTVTGSTARPLAPPAVAPPAPSRLSIGAGPLPAVSSSSFTLEHAARNAIIVAAIASRIVVFIVPSVS